MMTFVEGSLLRGNYRLGLSKGCLCSEYLPFLISSAFESVSNASERVSSASELSCDTKKYGIRK